MTKQEDSQPFPELPPGFTIGRLGGEVSDMFYPLSLKTGWRGGYHFSYDKAAAEAWEAYTNWLGKVTNT